MLELPGDLRFTGEAPFVKGFLGKLLVQALQGAVTEQIAVRRRMDATHATSAQLGEYAQVVGRGDALGVRLVVGDAVVTARRNALDDVNWLGPVLFARHWPRTVP